MSIHLNCSGMIDGKSCDCGASGESHREAVEGFERDRQQTRLQTGEEASQTVRDAVASGAPSLVPSTWPGYETADWSEVLFEQARDILGDYFTRADLLDLWRRGSVRWCLAMDEPTMSEPILAVVREVPGAEGGGVSEMLSNLEAAVATLREQRAESNQQILDVLGIDTHYDNLGDYIIEFIQSPWLPNGQVAMYFRPVTPPRVESLFKFE